MTHGLSTLLAAVVGELRCRRLFDSLTIDAALLSDDSESVSRAVIAQALNMLLFEQTSKQISIGAQAYIRDRVRRGEKLFLDHGAVRTIAAPCGAMPTGQEAITRLLLPLGYTCAGEYPVGERLTGRAYRHVDHPTTISQFFVSEVHPERFSGTCQSALQRVVADAVDPLEAPTRQRLDHVAAHLGLPLEDAAALLRGAVACFARHHTEPALADYETLARESPELAWFASEGNVFNHFTDRVDHVATVAERQRHLRRPIKRDIEVSASGRIVQTAFATATVDRLFVDAEGTLVPRSVPGVFLELISRAEEAPMRLDLGFDAANAEKLIAAMGDESKL